MDRKLPVAVVCRVLGTPRSSVDARRAQAGAGGRPGPATSISDHDLLGLIRQVLAASPFAGEGYRKVRARLRRQQGVRVSGNGSCGCCARRACWRRSGSVAGASHGRMTAPSSPTGRTSVGAPMPPWPGPAATGGCGCLPAWITPPPRRGRRSQGRRPVRRAAAGLRRGHRPLGPAGRRCRPRRAAAPQLGTAVPLGPLPRLDRLAGHQRRRRLPGRAGDQRVRRAVDPHLKQQCLWVQLYDTIDELRHAVTGFVDRYNTSWLIQRHGHLTPKEASQAAQAAAA
jgi:putative transposase